MLLEHSRASSDVSAMEGKSLSAYQIDGLFRGTVDNSDSTHDLFVKWSLRGP